MLYIGQVRLNTDSNLHLISRNIMASKLVPDLYASSKSESQGKAVATNWVKYVRKEAGLKQAFIFGTHDSVGGVGTGTNFNIEDQLKNGARFLDLHLATLERETWVYHDKAYITLQEAIIEIESFLVNNENEKVVLNLRESNNAPDAVNWANVRKLLKRGTHNNLVHKAQAEKPFSKMKGSIILLAPKALEMDGNWGDDAIAKFQTPEGLSTAQGLNRFLKEDSPSKDEAKPVWVECRSLETAETRRDKEIEAVNKYFVDSCGSSQINIITFQSVDENHFPGLKETLV